MQKYKIRLQGTGGRLLHINGKHTNLTITDSTNKPLINMGKRTTDMEIPDNAAFLTTTGVNVKVTTTAAQQLSPRMEMYDSLLEYREANGLPSLMLNHRLMDSSQQHSDYLASIGRIEHSILAGKTYGENVAVGYPTIDAAMLGWQHSPGHNANMLTTAATTVGLGYSNVGTGYKWYYVQQFI